MKKTTSVFPEKTKEPIAQEKKLADKIGPLEKKEKKMNTDHFGKGYTREADSMKSEER